MRVSKYINYDFILGGASAVENLWSELFAKICKGISPIMNECIILQKIKDLLGYDELKDDKEAHAKNEEQNALMMEFAELEILTLMMMLRIWMLYR